MKTVWFAVVFGAGLRLSASTVAVNAMGGAAAICPRHARSISIPCVRVSRWATAAYPHA
jgi:hypothetical protein